MNIEEKSKLWLKSNLVSDADKETIRNASKEDLLDMFYKDMEFGTAGMRGVIGPGSNRMNTLTVRKATVGFAQYLLKTFGEKAKTMGVVLSCDNRHGSHEFVLESSKVLNDFGINTYVFDSLRPTPELSFSVSYFKACGGIMITASHNPKEYNGYKVYDENGCQLVPAKTDVLIPMIEALGSETEIRYETVENRGVETIVGDEVDTAFLEKVYSTSLLNEPKKIKIVFTPQHGTSYRLGIELLDHLGYELFPVLEQCTTDPDFSATITPNPESPDAYVKAIELAKEVKADLILTTDPDADRVGVGFLNPKGEYELHTGNQTGALLIDYVLGTRKALNLLPSNGLLCNTIVTSVLGNKIAASYGVETMSFLTGFKFIGEAIEKFNTTGEKSFQFGYEESYGYIFKDFCRDKDSLEALLMIAEMTNHYYLKGLRLDEVLDNIYKKYGYHINKLYNIFFKGADGQAKMNALLEELREKPFNEVKGVKVIKVEDYLLQKATTDQGTSPLTSLPKSDVLKYYLADGSWFAIRPSGTEPKCKFYYEAIDSNKEVAQNKPNLFHQYVLKSLNLD